MESPIFYIIGIAIFFAIIIGWTRYVKNKSVKHKTGKPKPGDTPGEDS